jgi:hypothetical protein
MEARLVAAGVETRGQVLDLNNAGAFVATDLAMEARDEIEVELEVPGIEKSLPLKAIVARRIAAVEGKTQTIPAGLGLVFKTANVMERAFIQRAVIEALKASLQASRTKRGAAEAPARR